LGAKAPAVPEQSSVTFQSSETFQRSEPEQAKKQTNSPQTRANTRFRALNAQEGSREQREKNGGMRAWNGDIRRRAQEAKAENRANTGVSGKKNPNR
jgi:hypothetical protein